MRRQARILPGLAALAVGSAALAGTATPERRAGWWEMQVTTSGALPSPAHQVVHICTDPSIDHLQSPFGIHGGGACPPPQVERTSAGWSIASSCVVGGMTVATSGYAAGDLNSRYHVDLVTRMTPPPKPQMDELHIGIDARWLGPCPKGKKPGDVDVAMSTNIAPQGAPAGGGR
jgi:hypothetical protein